MTSKEALEMIVVDLVPRAKENNKEEIELIERDLEILEILKKIVSIKDYNKEAYPPFIILSGGQVKNIDEAVKIKEWIER